MLRFSHTNSAIVPLALRRQQGDYTNTWLVGSNSQWVLDEIEVFVRTTAESDPCHQVVSFACLKMIKTTNNSSHTDTPLTCHPTFKQTCAASSEQCRLPGRCVDGTCVYDDAPNGAPCDDGKLWTEEPSGVANEMPSSWGGQGIRGLVHACILIPIGPHGSCCLSDFPLLSSSLLSFSSRLSL